MHVQCVLLLLVNYVVYSGGKELGVRNNERKFPEGFLFGSATASYQTEGAWDQDGKSVSIWDHLTHTQPCLIKNCSDGDIANDSYHQYKRDVEMMRELGLDYYRFSLSWTRILPTSFPDKINNVGVEYYDNLINELLKHNIRPVITIYHWDLPQKLQEMGGWTNPYIVDWFADYARTVFELFGDRVKAWITINEPYIMCYQGYGAKMKAPLLNKPGVADYMCAKNVLLAHAKSYHIYKEEYDLKHTGEIGITLDAQWYEPASNSDDDIEAASDHNLFTWQLFANPIFSETGDFPLKVKEVIAEKSTAQGFLRSRLPEFTIEEVEYIRGTSDFFGLNHYFTMMVYRNESVNGYYEIPSLFDDMNVLSYRLDEWKLGDSEKFYSTPWGFYKLLLNIKENYNNPPVYILENGVSTPSGLIDEDRILYYRGYLGAMLDAIEDGANVKRYTTWSLMDNFEWMDGYTERLGLYEVDYSSPTRTRTPRKSAFVYKEILRTRQLEPNFEPADISAQAMTVDPGH